MNTKETILTYDDLLSVEVSENGSELVDLGSELPAIVCKYAKDDMEAYVGERIFVRKELIPIMFDAYKKLQKSHPGFTFKVQYGYRHPEVQQKYFTNRYAALHEEHSTLSKGELVRLTHMQVAAPEVAGHPTGGAIDVTILDDSGEQLDMGTKIADYSHPEKCYTYAEGITEVQKKNRALLSELLCSVGFAPFNGEWWHFSYGDREWAKYYGKNSSLFDQIQIKK